MSLVDIAIRFAPNTEQFTQGMHLMADAMRGMSVSMRGTTGAMREWARALRALYRPHRSGHRHRGTRAWILRNAPSRYDVPLGYRTMVKYEEGR